MIQMLTEQYRNRWDDYVMAHSDATFFHLSGWQRIIHEAFGHDTYYYYTERNGKITGILPLVYINSWLFGKSLVSNAFCVYGGIVADEETDFAALHEQARLLARTLNVDYLEFRHRQQRYLNWPHKTLYVTFRKELSLANGQDSLTLIPQNQRATVRKAIKAGLISRIDKSIDDFYRAYAESVRNLGTPIFSKRYFQLIKDEFADDCEILTVEHQGVLVSSVMSFYFKNEVLPYYGGGTLVARSLEANAFMYWEVMKRALDKGYPLFDFGRSKLGTGAYKFKKNLGFDPEPLFYEVDLVSAKQIPEINPLNPKYQLFIAAWKHLPLSLSILMGPWLAKDLG